MARQIKSFKNKQQTLTTSLKGKTMNHEIIETLGEGSSGITYKVKDEEGNILCKKKFKSVVTEEGKIRLQREIDIINSLNRDDVPKYFELTQEEHEGRVVPVLFYEFIEGESLDKFLKSNRPDIETIFSMANNIKTTIEYLHTRQPPVIHRDVKPQNIIITPEGTAVLIDYGQAVNDVARTYGATMVTGTLGYQASEQIIGMSTTKSDVYSLGVVLWEMLTGKNPNKCLADGRLRWKTAVSHLHPSVRQILSVMLEPNFEKRAAITDVSFGLEVQDIAVSDYEESEHCGDFGVMTANEILETFLEGVKNKHKCYNTIGDHVSDSEIPEIERQDIPVFHFREKGRGRGLVTGYTQWVEGTRGSKKWELSFDKVIAYSFFYKGVITTSDLKVSKYGDSTGCIYPAMKISSKVGIVYNWEKNTWHEFDFRKANLEPVDGILNEETHLGKSEAHKLFVIHNTHQSFQTEIIPKRIRDSLYKFDPKVDDIFSRLEINDELLEDSEETEEETTAIQTTGSFPLAYAAGALLGGGASIWAVLKWLVLI